jgi:hypothetical protein
MRGLGLCHGTTKKRIWASHAATKFPLILEDLSEGKLHFTGVCLLIRHLTKNFPRGRCFRGLVLVKRREPAYDRLCR